MKTRLLVKLVYIDSRVPPTSQRGKWASLLSLGCRHEMATHGCRAGFFGLFVLTGIRNAFVKREAAYLSLSLPGTKADLSPSDQGNSGTVWKDS